MDREDIIKLAREAGFTEGDISLFPDLIAHFAALVADAKREKLAAWMIERGYATGHGDTVEDLLKELEWQIAERIRNERFACAKVCEDAISSNQVGKNVCINLATAIRARGESEYGRVE